VSACISGGSISHRVTDVRKRNAGYKKSQLSEAELQQDNLKHLSLLEKAKSNGNFCEINSERVGKCGMGSKSIFDIAHPQLSQSLGLS
jgi:hypothetical protein